MPKLVYRWVLGHLIAPVETGGDFGLLLVTTPPKTEGPPPHFHEDASELFVILEGQLDVMCDGEWRTLAAGESFVAPPMSVHTFRNATDAPVKWVTTFSPAGFERFFDDFGILASTPGAQEASVAPDMFEKVGAKCQEYGMIIVPPAATD